MARRMRTEKDQAWVEEVGRAQMGDWVTVIYNVADRPDPTDPAAHVAVRVAVFVAGAEPPVGDLLSGMQEKWGYLEMSSAELDEHLTDIKETDHEAAKAERDDEDLMERRQSYYDRDKAHDELPPTEYELFWQAVEQYAQNEQDEDAWGVIGNWRARHTRYIEKGRV